MARTDPSLNVKVPSFVHDDLRRLKKALVAEAANETNLVAALIHAAKTPDARRALGKYRRDEALYREKRSGAAVRSSGDYTS